MKVWVCAEYILHANGQNVFNEWVMRGVAITVYGIACLSGYRSIPRGSYLPLNTVVVANNRVAMYVSNIFSAFKLLVLCLIVVTGWVVLGGGTRVKDSTSHFKNWLCRDKVCWLSRIYYLLRLILPNNNGNAMVSVLINVVLSYSGWNDGSWLGGLY